MKHTPRTTFLLTLLALAAALPAGTLVTRDGRTINGTLSLTGEQVKVTPATGPAQAVALKDVASADFADPSAPATPVAGEKRDKDPAGPPRVFVEYFADPALTDRRLACYQPAFRATWDVHARPDPLIPPRASVRMTARLTPLATEPHTFAITFVGPLRFMVDGAVVLDRWTVKHDNTVSVTVPLTGGRPTTLRLETGPATGVPQAWVTWTGRALGARAMTPEQLLPPEAPPAPVVTATTPGGLTHFRAPPTITVDAAVTKAPGRTILRVDLIAGGERLASATAAPYRLTWTDPRGGVYKIRARAVDDLGVSGYSDPIDVSVADTGQGGSLPAPWGSLALGKKDQVLPGTAAFADGAFTLTKAGGQVTEDDDAPQFVFQPVTGDFQLVARLGSLTPGDDFTGPLAGLIVREDMTSLDRYFAAVVGPKSTTLAKRPENWGRTSAGDRIDEAARWLKIVRLDNRLRAYTSADGQSWALLGAERIHLPPRVYVGLCAMARSRETAAVAAFDHVSLTAGPPELAHRVEGILFKNGTFLAAEVAGLKGGKVAYTKHGQRQTLPDSDVARLVYKAVPAELAEKVPTGQTGVLLGSGDFLDGELKDVTYQVTVSSIAFGQRTINIRYTDVLAIFVNDARPPALRYVLTATDGSTYQSKTLKAAGDKLALEDPTLGAIELSSKDVAKLRVNP